MDREQILERFKPYSTGGGGIEAWLGNNEDDRVLDRLASLASGESLALVQFNQLLILSREAGISSGAFKYYWLTAPEHTYDVSAVKPFDPSWLNKSPAIQNIDHLEWGLRRLYIDGLLYFGNVREAYRYIRRLTYGTISEFFQSRRINTVDIMERGPALELRSIPKDSRYLISEMACKSFASNGGLAEIKAAMLAAYDSGGGHGPIKMRDLLTKEKLGSGLETRQYEFEFTTDELLDEVMGDRKVLERRLSDLEAKWSSARDSALANTALYLSMVGDLDVYVATSMRNRADFRRMAETCEEIFNQPSLQKLHLRYFDPTMSSAESHEDKGLIECLMVKASKVLIYCAGEKESYGKDAEAAMALSQGKSVIFLCDEAQKVQFYREVHPLSRLIHFDTGVAVGAIVTSSRSEVSALLERIFWNTMEYDLDQKPDSPGDRSPISFHSRNRVPPPPV